MASNQVWFYLSRGKQSGPLSAIEIRANILSGDIPPDTMVWRTGMAGWEPANTITELVKQETGEDEPIDMEAMIWYYQTESGDNFGPINGNRLRQSIISGAIPTDVNVWHDQLEAYVPANQLPEFQQLTVKQRKLTRPPMAPHLKKAKNNRQNGGGDFIDEIISGIAFEGFLTIFGAVLIGALWLFHLPHKHLYTFYVLITYAAIIGIISLGSKFALLGGHINWMARARQSLCGFIFIGSIYFFYNHTEFEKSPDRAKLYELKKEWFPEW